MVERGAGSGRHDRLRPIGDTQASGEQHGQIVRAVTDRSAVGRPGTASAGSLDKRRELGILVEDRLDHAAGEPPVHDLEVVGHVPRESEPLRDPTGEEAEAARDQPALGAVRAHGGDERGGTGARDGPLPRPFQRVDRQAGQEPDALPQRFAEIELAVHGARRDGGDPVLDPGLLSQLVQRLARHDRGVHVGDETTLPPPDGRHQSGVDRLRRERGANAPHGIGRARRDGARNVAGAAGLEPVGRARIGAERTQGGSGTGCVLGTEPRVGAGHQDEYGIVHDPIMLSANAGHKPRAAAEGDPIPVVVLAGPTASGKSAVALQLAEALQGTVVNADSMQVYRELRVLTARPGPEDEARAPHVLYGILPAAERCSAGRWLMLAHAEIERTWADGRVPVVVGGTGLYLEALTEGLSPIPEIPAAVRAAATARLEQVGAEAFHALVSERDPIAAGRIARGDRQRLVRAYEVHEATGRPLSDWWAEPRIAPPRPYTVAAFVLEPSREALYAAADARFRAMVNAGAVDEVRSLIALGIDPGLPAMKALGVPEIAAHLDGRIDLDEATALAQKATRRFAKRQLTWFRHRLPGARRLAAQYSESLTREILPIIRSVLLTRQM